MWEGQLVDPLICYITSTLDQYGLEIAELGSTFQTDHIQKNGDISESSLDHIYQMIPNLRLLQKNFFL